MELSYDFRGEDNNLDMVAALLTMGMTPNVCFHKEKRKASAVVKITHHSVVSDTCLNQRTKFSSSSISGFDDGIEGSIDSQVIRHLQ